MDQDETIPRDSRRLTDDAFLGALRLPGAAGDRLALARARRDHAASVAVVAEHFRTRARPRWVFYMHGTPWLERDGIGVEEKAKALLRGVFHRAWHPFGRLRLGSGPERVDWVRAASVLSSSLTRTTFVPELTTAWSRTGRTDFLVALRQLLRGFVDALPFVLHEGFLEDSDRHFGGPCHSTGCVGLRVLRWLDLVQSGALRERRAFSDADVFWLVKQLWFYACQFGRMCGDPLRRDNHHLTDHGHAPYALGLLFPEFAGAPILLRASRRVIRHHIAANLFADGVYAEHCTRYQYHITFAHLHQLALSEATGDRLYTVAQRARLGRWVAFLAQACCPDGTLTSFGDEPGETPYNLFDVLAAPVMTPRLAATAHALGLRAGGPRRGPCLPLTARYPHGGFTFFRGSWTRGADYLAVSHYTDSLPHGHAHWDMMSFILHTGGRTLVGDPATWLYCDPAIWSPVDPSADTTRELRGYLYSVDAHNCLTVDDDTLKPLAHLGHRCVWGAHPPRHELGVFTSGGPIELTEMWHDANHACRHRRFVLHVRGLGFAFADIIEQAASDLRPHEYKQTFHFEPGVRLATRASAANAALHATRDAAACRILPGGEVRASWSLARDARLRGIHGACEPRTRQGPWVATLTRSQQGPCVFATFLPTGAAAARASVRHVGTEVAQPTYRQHAAVSANALHLGGAKSLLLTVNPARRPIVADGLETDAELAVVRLSGAGRPTAWLLVRGTRLAYAGRKLHAGSRRETVSGAEE